MKITVSATLLLYAAAQTASSLSTSSTENLSMATDTSEDSAITSSASGYTLFLPFGSIVLNNIQLPIPLLSLSPTKSTGLQKPSPFLPPITKSLDSMTICDAHGTEFLPSDCIASPTTSDNSITASQSNKQSLTLSNLENHETVMSTELTAESSKTILDNDVSNTAQLQEFRLHVMPTTGGGLAARQLTLKKLNLESHSDNDNYDASSSEASSNWENEQDSSESGILANVDSWSSIEESESELGGLDAWKLSESASFSDESLYESSSFDQAESDIGLGELDDGFGNLFTDLLESSNANTFMSSASISPEPTISDATSFSTPVLVVESSDVVSFAGPSSSILAQSSTENTDDAFSLNSPMSTRSEAALSSNTEVSVDDLTLTANSASWAQSSISSKSNALEFSETSHFSVSQSSSIKSNAESRSSVPILLGDTQIVETSGNEESSANLSSSVEYEDNDSSQNIPNIQNEDMGCTHGMFRCTADKRSFDTCVFGRWGTIRTCSQGTSCIPLSDNFIACG
ncbi:hypothetical protein COEREDRAFT_5594 [Coemansia reversa NRRL 1564]|uniref:Carbohydrate-binding module family 19 domain-containing protein n=1 Tax=Coemansia reversa (strain ATCC 12441 / NRRL 1564) TaxID=763665 RepID=A0A2G5BLA4_COERN|nr:hypothetical protein COEREDRAFT_5594 [Coemansia reversa NRRL 1564]|eukprot:PIA19790.1 hypothetical protein COEREDRAFT_5594 [Coemansia reversa NRRL 1564]